MMDLHTVTLCLTLIVSCGFLGCNGFDINSDISVSGENANGQTLIDMGEEMKHPWLRLIGYAIKNVEQTIICHPCTDWADWTACSTLRNEKYGSRMRTRACWSQRDGTSCTRVGEGTVEHKNEVCEGPCPDHYTLTESGICFMLNKTTATRDKAIVVCRRDGGYLMNIDTQARYDAVLNSGLTDYAYVDALRTAVGQPYVSEFGNDTLAQPFFSWYTGEPGDAANELSLTVRPIGGKVKWWDTSLGYKLAVLCEIRTHG